MYKPLIFCTVLLACAMPADAATALAKAQLSYQLIDLDPNDGIAPSLVIENSAISPSLIVADGLTSASDETKWFGERAFAPLAQQGSDANRRWEASVVGDGTPQGVQLRSWTHAVGLDHPGPTGFGFTGFGAEAYGSGWLFTFPWQDWGVRILLTPNTQVVWTVNYDLRADIRSGLAFNGETGQDFAQAIVHFASFLGGDETTGTGLYRSLDVFTPNASQYETGSETISVWNRDDETARYSLAFGVYSLAYGNVTAIPEPSTYLLMLVGLLGVAARRVLRR